MLHLFSFNFCTLKSDLLHYTNIENLQEGPVHDVQWSSNGDHFATVSGYMPAKINLFNARCKMLQELGAGPYNLVRWNPQVCFSLLFYLTKIYLHFMGARSLFPSFGMIL